MPKWLAMEDGGFAWLFGAPALMFALGSLTMLFVQEQDDDFSEPRAAPWRRLQEAWKIATEPGPSRGVAIVAMLYSTHFMLFPHYQALATQTSGERFDIQSLMIWTITQHTAVSLVSLIAGPLADRFGNRLTVRLTVFGSSLGPLTAIALSSLPSELMSQWYWLVFAPLGFTPVTMRMIINYTLELVDREEHPRHVAALGVFMAAPVLIGSPLLGLLVGWIGIVPVFALGAAIMLSAGLQTFFLIEPRHAVGGPAQ